MSRKFLLPHSKLLPYSLDYWGEVKQCLSQLLTSKHDNEADFTNFILKMLQLNGVNDKISGAGEEYLQFLKRTKSLNSSVNWSVDGVKSVLDKYSSEHRRLVQTNILSSALQLEDLFTQGSCPMLEAGHQTEVTLTRDQVRCLLSHMLLCTLVPMDCHKYWVSLQPWITSTNNPSQAYLTCLFHYFSQVDHNHDTFIKMQRLVVDNPPSLTQWRHSNTNLVSFEVVCPSYIGKQDCQEVEVDFANKDVGYGPGGTQEEILFGMTPEACPAVLLSPTLGDNECLLITGVRRMGLWTGYGWDVHHSGHGDGSSRTILCMDALELEDDTSDKNQAGGQLLRRELEKCFTGFCGVKDRIVATGAWGCGAFGGDKEVKFAIQLAAASEAGVQMLRYHTTDKMMQEEIHKIANLCRENVITVGTLVSKLQSFSDSGFTGKFLEFFMNSTVSD